MKFLNIMVFLFFLGLQSCTAKEVLPEHSLRCVIQELEASSVTKQELSGAGLALQHVWIC